MIEVRRADIADAHALGEIHAVSWEISHAPFFAPKFGAQEVRDRRTRWPDRLRDGPGTVLLALLDERPMAFCWFRPSQTRPGQAEVYSLYAHPDGWGTGVAATLMTETLRLIRAEGVARVHLWTLRDTPQSRRFYVKSGFTETGKSRHFDYGDGTPIDQVEYARAC
ncbi:MAG TPA: GNAT family N-acetyltransferase [Pseudonocardiaceae bacterium]|jgi:GNAT superfamily N-acetyltransferase|nr:GNAT family N-acetyltransferase [Pseudonocardiaceae bacterium]